VRVMDALNIGLFLLFVMIAVACLMYAGIIPYRWRNTPISGPQSASDSAAGAGIAQTPANAPSGPETGLSDPLGTPVLGGEPPDPRSIADRQHSATVPVYRPRPPSP
jgi:hypothetical protein